jgi:hypothetical protein
MSDPVAALRNLQFPLNVFALGVYLEEGKVDSLHHGLFQSADEDFAAAQQHCCDILLDRLPPPPCRILEVGVGLGTMLATLRSLGYDVHGITPDAVQMEIARAKIDADLICTSLEDFDGRPGSFDILLFHESSQYVDPLSIFGKAYDLLGDGGQLFILDEVALKRVEFGPEGLHLVQTLVELAEHFGFELCEQLDLSARALPTQDYLLRVVERHRERLVSELACTSPQIDALMASNRAYREKHASGRFGYAFLRFRKARVPRWRIESGGEACGDAMRPLFRCVFGHEMSEELWQWKYRHPRGRSLVAWKNGEMVAHYGGVARTVCFFGEPRTVVQIADVMVHPSERSVLTKKGGFYLTASAFKELNVGYGREYAAGFGFPNERHMRLAQKLGLYGEIDKVVEVNWRVTERPRWWTTGRVIGTGARDEQWVNRVWERMRLDLKHAVVGVRDWDYLRYRYLSHPTINYDVIGVSSRFGRSLGVVVLKRDGTQWELMDVVGALADFPRLLRFAQGFVARGGAERMCCWVAESFSRYFKDGVAEIKNIGVSVPSNISVFGPPIAEMERRWWLVSGDTDFK